MLTPLMAINVYWRNRGEQKQRHLNMNQNVFDQSHGEAKGLIKLCLAKDNMAETNFTKPPHKTRGLIEKCIGLHVWEF